MSAATPIQRDMSVPFQPLPDAGAGAGGAALQNAADQITDFAVANQKRQDQKDLITARLDATKQLDALSDQFRADTDPDTMAQRFSAKADEIGQAVGKTLVGDPANAFNADYGMMAESRLRNIKDMAFSRQTEQAIAGVDDTIETNARAAAFAANPAERQLAINNVAKAVDGTTATGMMSAEAGQKKLQTFKERLALYDGKSAVFVNPAQALARLKDGQYLPDLDPISRIELLNSAEAEVRTREREARQAQAMNRLEADQAAQDFHEVIQSGLPVSQAVVDRAKATALASGDPHAMSKVVGLLHAQGFADAMRGASPREVDAGLVALAKQANAQGADAGMATAMIAATSFKAKMTEALSRDPLMWGARQGVVNITPLKLNGGDAPADFANRVQQAKQISQRYGVPFQPLTAAETETLKSSLSAEQDPNSRLATLQAVVKGFGANAVPVLSKLGAADPTIANAGALIASGDGHYQAARDVLTGSRMLAGKGSENLRPSPAAQAGVGLPAMMSAFAMMPDTRDQVITGAGAMFAARAARQGIGGSNAANSGDGLLLYQRAVQEAAGARFDAGGAQYGGLTGITRNGTWSGGKYWVQVPRAVKADGFEDLVHNLDLADLTHASVTGKAPKWEGGDAPADLIRHTWLVSGGNGVYSLSATNPLQGQIRPVLDKTGQPFRFRFDNALAAMQARTHGAR